MIMDNEPWYHLAVTKLKNLFENFWGKYLITYDLDPWHFYSALRVSWVVALKRQIELELLTDINILFIFAKGVRSEIRNSTFRYEKQLLYISMKVKMKQWKIYHFLGIGINGKAVLLKLLTSYYFSLQLSY